MSARWRRLALLLLLAGALAWRVIADRLPRGAATSSAVAVPADQLVLGRTVLEPCLVGDARGGAPSERAYCTRVSVPEDWSAPQGRHIDLKVAVVRASTASPDADLVAFLDGGPGGAATSDYPAVAGALAPLRKRHALLLVDQRGTGGSNPLSCEAPPASAAEAAATRPQLAQLQECVKRLRERAAPEHYATSDAVRDLEAVRQALGAPLLDLVGVSYGTRMAQQYARAWPASVRAVVLDSPVPNELALGSENSRNLDEALERLAARCAARQDCAARHGDVRAAIRRVQSKLAARPQPLELRDPYTFEPRNQRIDGNAYAQLLRFYAYSPLTAALIPYVTAEADAGRYGPLLGQAQLVVGEVEEHIGGGMALSVLCAEDADRLHDDDGKGTLLGTGLATWLRQACAAWPHGARPQGFNEPWQSNLPVLVLSGSEDPVTPVRYGTAIVKHLPRGRLLELAGQGHAVIGTGCVPRLVDEFLRTLDARALDARCLQQLGQVPAFLGANGAAP